MRSLLKQRDRVNTPQADGSTALAWAAHRDDLETAELLIRAGFIHKEMAGVYSYLPLGLLVLKKIYLRF